MSISTTQTIVHLDRETFISLLSGPEDLCLQLLDQFDRVDSGEDIHGYPELKAAIESMSASLNGYETTYIQGIPYNPQRHRMQAIAYGQALTVACNVLQQIGEGKYPFPIEFSALEWHENLMNLAQGILDDSDIDELLEKDDRVRALWKAIKDSPGLIL